jgi:hypothetical protein
VQTLSIDEDAALIEQLIQRREAAKNLAKANRRFAEPPRYFRHGLLLLAWISAGGDLEIKKARKSRPLPEGAVISYLQAADQAIFRRTKQLSVWQIEHIVKAFKNRLGSSTVTAI